ncbi:MAG: recombination protein RecR [Candidatus Harrisonbacteria bacterium CG10_big_fil_rev_8_21_14_0_10_38_8]|uniref:Recombination protein RecR n=1 Tax=Candidatus Harrisonbacteria bacterium CG10_big_fil_rev_8_21_14_0_10_38_8 TaxID=1974582 RepID=A0A2M6WKU2_9BACT|nr:MAG: recombination protein RecR [Candidatus Harrisonbacteria bacterium CG10_big_fil_rev_8_21_14_0_10_38_8]
MINPIEQFAVFLQKLPSLGPRQAFRLALYISNMSSSEQLEFKKHLEKISSLKTCPMCFLKIVEACEICSDRNRSTGLVAIVEKETDKRSLENTGIFTGQYLLLGELNKDGILTTEHKRRLGSLKDREVKEVILALSPTVIGDVFFNQIKEYLNRLGIENVSGLARGITTGSDIEFADSDTLIESIKNRKK